MDYYMQKIKNEKGITLAALVVTIIVLMIILSISIGTGMSSVKNTKDRKFQAELQVVQQACISEYTKAKQLGYLVDNSTIPLNFVGTPIDVLTEYPNVSWVLNNADTAIGYKKYFSLDSKDLEFLSIRKTELLGIQKSEYEFIVNYYTGEVYNKTIRETSKHIPLYIKSVETHQTDNNNDNTSFVDNNTWYTE